MQLRLEGICLNPEGLLASYSKEGDGLPLALFVSASDGQTAFFQSEEISPELRDALDQKAKEIQFPFIESLADMISRAGAAVRMEHFKTYRFPEDALELETKKVQCLLKQDPRVVDFGFGGFAGEVYVAEEGGAVVSACASARENKECAEAWVYTAEPHRRRGLALRTVRAWARGMQARNLTPFYSHKMENFPSAGLAQRLSLSPVFEEMLILQDGPSGAAPV